jgi:hypothetical protein
LQWAQAIQSEFFEADLRQYEQEVRDAKVAEEARKTKGLINKDTVSIFAGVAALGLYYYLAIRR